MKIPIAELATSVYQHLLVDPEVTIPIYQATPQSIEFPYARIGRLFHELEPNKTDRVLRAEVDVDVVTDDPSLVELGGAVNQVSDSLERAELVIAGWLAAKASLRLIFAETEDDFSQERSELGRLTRLRYELRVWEV